MAEELPPPEPFTPSGDLIVAPNPDFAPSGDLLFPEGEFEIVRTDWDVFHSIEYDQPGITVLAGHVHFSDDLHAPVIADDTGKSLGWDMVAPVLTDGSASLASSLVAPALLPHFLNAGWDLVAPTWTPLMVSASWAVIPPVFTAFVGAIAYVQHGPALKTGRFQFSNEIEAIAVWRKAVSSTAYIFSLERGETSVEIPISSFSCQLRSGESSYLQCSIPNAPKWADEVSEMAAFEDTEMVIRAGYRWSDDSYTTQEIARTLLRNIRMDIGSKSSSISLDGIDTRTNSAPKTVHLNGSSYRMVADSGLVRYRVSLDFSVRPGDTAIVDGDEFIIGELSYQVSPDNATMEVAEKA